jgi:hypothetical protein
MKTLELFLQLFLAKRQRRTRYDITSALGNALEKKQGKLK